MATEVVPRSGYEFAEKIVSTHDKKGDVVETLLRYADNDECDFLELKASVYVRQEDLHKGEKSSDIFWNIAHELIAMINSHGGILIIGVSDRGAHEVVPLRWHKTGELVSADELDHFIRQDIAGCITPNNHRWEYKGEKFSIDNELDPYLDLRRIRYQDQTVLAYLIRPLDGKEILSQPSITVGGRVIKEAERLPYRKGGMFGQCNDYDTRDQQDQYHAQHQTSSIIIGEWYNELVAEQQAETDAARLDQLIINYRDTLVTSARKTKVGLFVDLDAESQESEDDIDNLATFNDADSVPIVLDDELADNEDSDGEHLVDDGLRSPAKTAESSSEDLFTPIRRNLLDLLNDESRLSLIGEPGAGKTLSLQCFAFRRMKDATDHPDIYIYIPLGQWSDSLGGSVEALAQRFSGISWHGLEKLIAEHRLHLILDALNECPDELKPGAIHAISSFLGRYPTVPIVISARTIDDIRPFALQTYEVRPMNHDQQLAFLSKYLRDGASAETLLERIHAQPGGETIAANPMLLRMVSEVVNDTPNAELPNGRAGLYRRWVTRWYDREAKKARKAKKKLLFDSPTAAIDLLSRIAFVGRIKGYRDIPLGVFTEAFPNITLHDPIFEGPLLTIQDETLHFRHESFQEYLCAEALLNNPSALTDSQHISYATWGMPLAYAFELSQGQPYPEELISCATTCSRWFGWILKGKGIPSPADGLSYKDLASKRWQWKGDLPLRYVLVTIADSHDQWFEMELSLFKRLLLSNDISSDTRLLYQSFGNFFYNLVLLKYKDLVVRGIAIDRLFDLIQFRPSLMFTLFYSGFIDQTDLLTISKDRLTEIKSCPFSSASQLIMLAQKGILTKEECRPHIVRLAKNPAFVIETAADLIKAGLASKDDFVHNLVFWRDESLTRPEVAERLFKANIWSISELLVTGLAQNQKPLFSWLVALCPAHGFDTSTMSFIKKQLAEVLTQWKEDALTIPFIAIGLIKMHFCKIETFLDEFAARNQPPSSNWLHGLLNFLDPQAIKAFIHKYFPHCIKQWRYDALSNPTIASDIVSLELSTIQELVDGFSAQGHPPRFSWLVGVFSASGLSSDHKAILRKCFSALIIQWRKEAVTDSSKAIDMIKSELCCVQEFIDEFATQNQKPTFTWLFDLFSLNGVPSADRALFKKHFASLIGEWRKDALTDATRAIDMIMSNLCSRGELIDEFISQNQVPTCSWLCYMFSAKLPQGDRAFKRKHFASLILRLRKQALVDDTKAIDLVKSNFYSITELLDGFTSQKLRPAFGWIAALRTAKIIHDGHLSKYLPRWFPEILSDPVKAIDLIRSTSCPSQILLGMFVVQKRRPTLTWLTELYAAGFFHGKELKTLYPQLKSKLPSDTDKAIKMLRKLTDTQTAPKPAAPTRTTNTRRDQPPPKNHLSIYIDETWPGSQNCAYKDIGVIGGIVVPWAGINDKLPVINTHLSTGAAKSAIKTMLAVKEVTPFVFPIKVDSIASTNYFKLVQHAIMMLLGWIIPHPKSHCTIDIYLERFSRFNEGHTETDFFKTLTAAMDLLSNNPRFKDFSIGKVEWTAKNFEYVPYGDLVCKTCVPLPDQQNLAKEVKVRQWPGYVPFTPQLFPVLQEMDNASPAGYADHLISFAKVCHGTTLFQHIFADAVKRAQNNSQQLDAILEKTESCYTAENRDVELLNRISKSFLEKFSVSALAMRPRAQMLRILLGLQYANHNGDPDLAKKLVVEYMSLRTRLIQFDRTFCADIDANVIAHLHDLFEFRKAHHIADIWLNDPLFPALPISLRAKLLSSCAQSLSLLGRYEEANDMFKHALALFSSESALFKSDIGKTSCYQTFNLLKINPAQALFKISSLIGGALKEIASEPQRLSSNPFYEHLFLKALWNHRNIVQDAVDLYCEHSGDWSPIRNYHPYELILFYRTLMLSNYDQVKARESASKLTALFEQMDYGGVIGFIRSYMRVQLKRLGINCATSTQFYEELDIVAIYLPAASSQIQTLKNAWNNADIDISDVLPFYYI